MPTVESLVIAGFLLIYATVVMIILLKNVYLKYLKFFVILFDYLYVFLSFIFDPNLTSEKSIIIWYAFAGVIVFYFIDFCFLF